MSGPDFLNPHPPEFDRFLHAAVGEDRNGYVVTVLSALARLGLDPWNETAELVMLGREAARTRLGLLLSRFRDVPALGSDHGEVAQKLSLLLPESSPARSLKGAVADGRLGSSGVIWMIFAMIFLLFQMIFGGEWGEGE